MGQTPIFKALLMFLSISLHAVIKARGGSGVQKQIWLISKSNLSWSYYFLQHCKILVNDENLARQKFEGTAQSHTKNRGIECPKTTIFYQYFQK